jgi:hypothetical protein
MERRMRIPRMANLVFVVGLLVTAAAFTAVGANVPQEVDWRSGKLRHLFQYVGTYNFEAIFDDPFVRRAMEELLGDNVSHLRQNLKSRGSIEIEGQYLALWGQKPHEGHLENAILVINVYDGKIHAGIFSNGRTTIFSKVDKETADYFEPELLYGLLPDALRRFVRWDEIEELMKSEPKTNFRWVK